MSTPENRIVVAIETLLRGMPKATRDLSVFEKRLRSLSNIKISTKPIPTAQFERSAIAAQKLVLQQQKLAVQALEVSNRQEKARQAADRLAQSQQRLAQSAERLVLAQSRLAKSAPQADSHVRFFRQIQKAAGDADRHVQFFKAHQAQLAKAPPADNHVRMFRAMQKAANDAERALKKAPQMNAHVEAFRALEKAAKKSQVEIAKVEAQKKRLAAAAGSLDKSLNRVGGTLSRIGSGLASFGRTLSVAVTAPLAALGAISVKSARDIDDQVNTLRAFTGSSEAAEERLAKLIATAQQTPGLTTSLGLILDSQLRVADVTVETIDKIVPAIGKLNAVSRLQDPQRFAQNMVQLVTQNFERIDLKELIGQSPLAGQIIKELFNVDSPINAEAIRESAKKMGLTTTDAFFAAFAEAAGRNRALATITESISSRFGKAVDRVMIALRPLGLAIIGAITPAINALVPIIEKLGKAFADLPKPAQQAILIIGGLAVLLGPALVIVGGLITSIGGLVTALGAVASVVSTIGLPALVALIGGIVIVIGEWVAILAALGLAWKNNFLNIRTLVTSAANAVLQALNRIRAVIEEAIQRILPTLQSITTKVLNAITAVWDRYGATVIRIVSTSFAIATRIIETFLRFFGNLIDLILKLIDGDWRGAWRAFSRIIINALDSVTEFFTKAQQIFERGMKTLSAFILRQSAVFVEAGKKLAVNLLFAIASALVAGYPQIRDALSTMLLLAAAGIAGGPIAAIIVQKLLNEMRKAAGEGVSIPVTATEQGLARIRLNPDGSLKTDPRAPPPIPPGDKKTASALRKAQDDLAQAQNEFQKQEAQSRLELARAGIQQQFDLTKDGLDRELNLLENNFDDRVVAVRNYFQERRRLQEAAIDAELTREKALSGSLTDEFVDRRKQIEREFQSVVVEIGRDPSLKGRSKELALQTAETEKQTKLAQAQTQFETENAAVSTRILLLQKQRKDVATELGRAEAILLRELQQQEAELRAQLFEDQGQTADAAGVRLRQRFKDTIQELRIDIKSLPPELQNALNAVDIKTLKGRLAELPEPVRDLIALLEIAANRAITAELSVNADRALSELRLREVEIQNKVLDGVLSERDARAQIAGLQQISKARLLDILAAQLRIAESTAGQEDEVLQLRQQIQEIERLGAVIDDTGRQINQELFSNIEQGLEGVFQNARRGFEGLKDAAISFGESLLNTLNKIAAQSITQRLEGIFKPDAENTKGTPGGFLSKLFGLSPKAADTTGASALATAATAAGTAITTGGTTAGAAMATGGATASTALVASITTASASFAAVVTAAAATFAATIAAAGSTQALGGIGGALGAAKGGLFSPQPGGRLGIFAEGGYPEAVLTTDPKHASRQLAILQTYLRKTKGLFGRVSQQAIPHFETGGFISPRETEMNLLSSITRSPSLATVLPQAALANAGGGQARGLRIILVKDMREVRDYLNSAEGEQVIVERLGRNQSFKRMIRG